MKTTLTTLLALIAVCFAREATGQALLTYEAGLAGAPAVAPDPLTQGWSLDYPTGTGVVISDASPDGSTGLNAWVISDQGSGNGERASYYQLISAQQVTEAYQKGWELEIDMRVLQTSGFDVVVEYAEGQAGSARRYLAWFESQGNDVLVTMSIVGTSYLCPGAMDGNHHSFVYRKAPGVDDAEFFYDGQLMGTFPAGGSGGGAPNGGVSFGTGSSAGQGTIYVHAVGFKMLENNGSSFCDGDGSGTVCPCGNLGGAGEGCRNSFGSGGVLSASGNADLTADSLVLAASQCAPFRSGVFIQADGMENAGAGSLFGDGLLCVQGGMIVLEYAPTDGGGGATSSVVLSQAGGVSAGDTRAYQYWFRDQSGPCAGQFNLTNGRLVTW